MERQKHMRRDFANFVEPVPKARHDDDAAALEERTAKAAKRDLWSYSCSVAARVDQRRGGEGTNCNGLDGKADRPTRTPF